MGAVPGGVGKEETARFAARRRVVVGAEGRGDGPVVGHVHNLPFAVVGRRACKKLGIAQKEAPPVFQCGFDALCRSTHAGQQHGAEK